MKVSFSKESLQDLTMKNGASAGCSPAFTATPLKSCAARSNLFLLPTICALFSDGINWRLEVWPKVRLGSNTFCKNSKDMRLPQLLGKVIYCLHGSQVMTFNGWTCFVLQEKYHGDVFVP